MGRTVLMKGVRLEGGRHHGVPGTSDLALIYLMLAGGGAHVPPAESFCDDTFFFARVLDDFEILVDEGGAQDAVGFVQNLVQHFSHVFFLVGQRNDADDGTLPDVVMVEFGDGHVEFAAKFVFQASQNLALVFQGLRVGDVDFES
jgi:hypothetical protein